MVKFVLLALLPAFINAQINAYAKVTNISGNVLTLSNVNQAYDSLQPGDRILIIQMQGATIADSSNTSSFGNMASANSAGLYEPAVIAAVNGAATSLTLTSPLSNPYNPTRSVQLLSYPQLGVTDYTTQANLSPLPWNGSTGGVIVFSVNGKLNLAHNITANGMGFRGGNQAGPDGGSCEDNTWRTSAGNAKYADKGEGVYITSFAQKAGKGKAVNGGGGGIVHNGGGGGGGNATAGGSGFYGYPGSSCSASLSGGGQGGQGIFSSKNRVFMGGGGGGGQHNNASGSSGGNGGGIILIKADSIIVEGACFPLIVSANGAAAAPTGNDGGGGGGAGGTILLDVNGIRVNNMCPITITASGGDGADVNNGVSHGSGGGGGQGRIFVAATGTFANTFFATNGGQGGDANTSGSPKAENGTGSPGSGITFGAGSSALPVKWMSFEGYEVDSGHVQLSWKTATERRSSHYDVLHTVNGVNWTSIGTVIATGNSFSMKEYSYQHSNPPSGLNYYKLRQVDIDDISEESKIVSVDVSVIADQRVFPVPAADRLTIISSEVNTEFLLLRDIYGSEIAVPVVDRRPDSFVVDVSRLSEGFYYISIDTSTAKIIIKR